MPASNRIPSAERRIQILDAARQIILRDGGQALTMQALAEAVGVTKPIVYKHFSNSEDVVIEILREYGRGSVSAAAVKVKGAKTLYEFLDGVIESLFDYIRKEGAIVRGITTGFSSSSNVDMIFLKHKDQSHRVYRHLLLQQGAPEQIADVAASALMEMIDNTVNEYADNCDPTDRETLKTIVRGAVRAVIPRGRGVKPSVPAELLNFGE